MLGSLLCLRKAARRGLSATMLGVLMVFGMGFGTPLSGLAATWQAPEAVVQQVTEQLLVTLQAEDATAPRTLARTRHLVDQVLGEHMDFVRMSRWVLGRYWKHANPDQQTRFISEFRQLLVRTYASAFMQYNGEHIKFLPQRDSAIDNQAIVRTELVPSDAPPIAINYSLYLTQGQWKAYDVQIDGISLVANYRASFAAQVRKQGIEGLIQSLAKLNTSN